MKKIIIICVAIVLILGMLALLKDALLKSVISVVAGQTTGTTVTMDKFSLCLLRQSVTIKDFKMSNPSGFSKSSLVDLPKISVALDSGALLKKKLHIKNIEVNLKELLLEKNKGGELNVDSLKIAKPEKKEGGDAPPIPMQIDEMKLDIGKIVSFDYSGKRAHPAVLVYDVNLHKTYKNITSAQQLAALIITEPMKAAGIRSAGIYGAAMLTGVGFIPVAIAATFISKTSANEDFAISPEKAYEVSTEVVSTMGKITKQNKKDGTMDAEVEGANVNLKITQTKDKKTNIMISARKLMLPKPEVAAGILYMINKKI